MMVFKHKQKDSRGVGEKTNKQKTNKGQYYLIVSPESMPEL